ncbi:hypothetical protein PCL_01191 [Purpureocillium lilacinum]|uniref:Acetolactate synthase n=1 Tax=Purpureocillium lilacinum TaxID=33203 RepID=A0A2U3E4Z3_PURLI|nr:hypothetical protein PCL_01191 [Purpureocillium lilacinum]
MRSPSDMVWSASGCDFGSVQVKRESGPPKAEAPASLAASACMVTLGTARQAGMENSHSEVKGGGQGGALTPAQKSEPAGGEGAEDGRGWGAEQPATEQHDRMGPQSRARCGQGTDPDRCCRLMDGWMDGMDMQAAPGSEAVQWPVNGRPVDNNRRRHQTSSSIGAPGVDGLSTTTEDLRRALLVKAHQILTLVRRIVACTSGEPGGGAGLALIHESGQRELNAQNGRELDWMPKTALQWTRTAGIAPAGALCRIQSPPATPHLFLAWSSRFLPPPFLLAPFGFFPTTHPSANRITPRFLRSIDEESLFSSFSLSPASRARIGPFLSFSAISSTENDDDEHDDDDTGDDCEAAPTAAMMLRSRQASKALRALGQARHFTSTTQPAAVQAPRKIASGQRNQATAATATSAAPNVRATPSPAFNAEEQQQQKHSHVQPLVNPQKSDMDESFIGKTGGEIFHEMMLRQGVKHIFGYPGGAILPVFDAIYNSKHFDFILPRHEQGAGHMAEGYARASGKPGVVLVTSGPGATNVVTPMQDALSDGTPLVVFCGQVPTSAIGSDAFQEADVVGISRACTKWNVMVKNVAELPRRINEAFEIATSGRPGPVLVDLPKDVTAGILRRAIPTETALPALPSAASRAAMESSRKHLEHTIKRVADLVNRAKQPVIYAGQGIIQSEGGPELLKELADKASIPVTTTLQGLGGFDELDEKSLHMLGMHGSAYANMAMQEADLIIALGARFDDRVTLNVAKFAPGARAAAAEKRGGIVHFEVMPKNINKVVQATEAVEGNVGSNLKLLLPEVQAKTMDDRKEWFGKINEWKKKWPLSHYERAERHGLIKPQTLIEELSKLTADRKDKTYIATGVGQHQMWTAQHFRWRHPRSMITSGGLGTMGFGLPAAIGAKVAQPDALVFDIDGDASFGMTLTELATAAQFNIGVKVIVLNNEEQGMVTQWQNLFYEDRYAHTHQVNPDFMKLAESMRVQGRRCVDPEDVVDSLKWLINTDGPALLEVVTDKKVPVLPMVPAGSALHEFLVFDGEKDKKRRELMRERTSGLHG